MKPNELAVFLEQWLEETKASHPVQDPVIRQAVAGDIKGIRHLHRKNDNNNAFMRTSKITNDLDYMADAGGIDSKNPEDAAYKAAANRSRNLQAGFADKPVKTNKSLKFLHHDAPEAPTAVGDDLPDEPDESADYHVAKPSDQEEDVASDFTNFMENYIKCQHS